MVEKRTFRGNRQEVIDQLAGAKLPTSWGQDIRVKEWALWHIPSGPTWHGDFTLAGYHTPANDDGTGTVFLSCAWSPDRDK